MRGLKTSLVFETYRPTISGVRVLAAKCDFAHTKRSSHDESTRPQRGCNASMSRKESAVLLQRVHPVQRNLRFVAQTKIHRHSSCLKCITTVDLMHSHFAVTSMVYAHTVVRSTLSLKNTAFRICRFQATGSRWFMFRFHVWKCQFRF